MRVDLEIKCAHCGEKFQMPVIFDDSATVEDAAARFRDAANVIKYEMARHRGNTFAGARMDGTLTDEEIEREKLFAELGV